MHPTACGSRGTGVQPGSAKRGGEEIRAARGVHKFGQVAPMADLQGDRVSAPHEQTSGTHLADASRSNDPELLLPLGSRAGEKRRASFWDPQVSSGIVSLSNGN
jgi:hypothetical protein